MNRTLQNYDFAVNGIVYALVGLIFLLTVVVVVSNLMIIIAICQNRCLRTDCNIFIALQSLMALFTAIYNLVVPVMICMKMFAVSQPFCFKMTCFSLGLFSGSTLLMLIIGVDRLWAMKWPVSYRNSEK